MASANVSRKKMERHQELDITLDIVGDGDEDTIEMEDVWTRIVIAEDCMVHALDKRVEFAVNEATALSRERLTIPQHCPACVSPSG